MVQEIVKERVNEAMEQSLNIRKEKLEEKSLQEAK